MEKVAKLSDFGSSDRIRLKVDSESYLIVKHNKDFYAISNKCPHLGLSMSRAKIVGDEIVCPWHGSRFAICNGENKDWANSFAGVPMPSWSHKLIGLGRKPAPIKSVKLVQDGDFLFWPGD